ncbi:hypothetical protein D9M68_871490 [compost metagenome]
MTLEWRLIDLPCKEGRHDMGPGLDPKVKKVGAAHRGGGWFIKAHRIEARATRDEKHILPAQPVGRLAASKIGSGHAAPINADFRADVFHLDGPGGPDWRLRNGAPKWESYVEVHQLGESYFSCSIRHGANVKRRHDSCQKKI